MEMLGNFSVVEDFLLVSRLGGRRVEKYSYETRRMPENSYIFHFV